MVKDINTYKVIVIGAGIAGSEAAMACADMGIKTLIINISMDSTAILKYSSKFGGVKKSSIIKEIDLMGGFIKKAVENNTIVKIINCENGKKFPVYRVDKRNFSLFYKHSLEKRINLDTRQGLVCEIKKNENEKYTVILNDGSIFYSEKIIIAAGTFMNGKLIYGGNIIEAGRHGEIPSIRLAKNLNDMGYGFKKIKTYVSPIIDGKTIDISKLKKIKAKKFTKNNLKSNIFNKSELKKIFNYNTYIEEDLLKNIIENIDDIDEYDLYKYAKTIKNYSFPENIKFSLIKNGLFEMDLYMEGSNTMEIYADIYLSGLSEKKQQEIINIFYGLEDALLTRPGYIIEYDILKMGQLENTFSSKIDRNIYFCGQINGTQGYEESAAQGFISGINASLDILGKGSLAFDKNNTALGFLENIVNNKNFNPPIDIDFEKYQNFKNFDYEKSDKKLSCYIEMLNDYRNKGIL